MSYRISRDYTLIVVVRTFDYSWFYFSNLNFFTLNIISSLIKIISTDRELNTEQNYKYYDHCS